MSELRWGLCCQFLDAPIRFRRATHRYVATLTPRERRAYLSSIARANAIALAHAIERCHELGIGAFRISSQLLPLATHPSSGYALDGLDDADVVLASFRAAGALARSRDIRLSFHPDQFVVLNSATERVVTSSIAELGHQARVAALIGADTICLHAGGAAGGKRAALERLERALDRLSDEARRRLALENDDRVFTVRDLVPLCVRHELPLVYDVHHHRANPDDLSTEAATELATATWNGREPWVHLSSPRDGWSAPDPRPHADFVDPADFPAPWLGRRLTIDVEAKAKERAVLAIRDAVRSAITPSASPVPRSSRATPGTAARSPVRFGHRS